MVSGALIDGGAVTLLPAVARLRPCGRCRATASIALTLSARPDETSAVLEDDEGAANSPFFIRQGYLYRGRVGAEKRVGAEGIHATSRIPAGREVNRYTTQIRRQLGCPDPKHNVSPDMFPSNIGGEGDYRGWRLCVPRYHSLTRLSIKAARRLLR